MSDINLCDCLTDPDPEGVYAPGGVTPDGIGLEPPKPAKPFIWPVLSGDTNTMTAKVTLADGITPATPANSLLTFSLAETQFCDPPIWQGTWLNGIEEVVPNSGIVKIALPAAVLDCLRRGSYMFSLRVSDKLGTNVKTLYNGSILVEYAVGGPQHDIPYKHDVL